MSNAKTHNNKQNSNNNSTTKTICALLYDSASSSSKTTLVNNNNNILNRLWSSLFAKVKRRQSTFSLFLPRNNIKSKNNNTLILDIYNLDRSLNEIIVSLYE